MIGSGRLLRDIAVFAIVFQVVHFIEHVAQLGYWFVNSSQPPWLTPWAAAGRDLLAVDGTPGGGNELLHLVGNLIFLGGVVALTLITWNSGRRIRQVRHLSTALIIQGLHVGEHILLTISYFAVGSAIGFTTLFGAAQGAFGSSLRIWAHFLLNLTATYYALRAAWEMYGINLGLDRSRVTRQRGAQRHTGNA